MLQCTHSMIQHFSICAERMKGYLPFSHFIPHCTFSHFFSLLCFKKDENKAKMGFGMIIKDAFKESINRLWKNMKRIKKVPSKSEKTDDERDTDSKSNSE